MAVAQQSQHVTKWAGWIGFASLLMGFSGIIHIIYGIGGIFSQSWYIYTANSALLVDPSAWGWSMIITGVLLLISTSLLMAGNMAGRIIGGILAFGSLLFNLAIFPAAPVWSLLAAVVDVLILYAIIAHGKEMKELRASDSSESTMVE